jgi:hypothetical protein
MGANVFANGREVSAKANNNKSIAAMPDVCMSPPSPPAGPIPIPYPNFSQASKTDSGSKKVKIKNKPVGLKNKSTYKKSNGNEAATRSFGMGIVTHKLQGETKHAAWSFDVKFEGQNVIRHLDLTTHNHGSDPNNSGALTVDVGSVSKVSPKSEECKALESENRKKRKEIGQQDDSSTVTHANYTPPGEPTQTIWSSSRSLAAKYKNSGYAGGVGYKMAGWQEYVMKKNSEVKVREYYIAEPSNVNCDQAKHTYRQGRKTQDASNHSY